MSTAPRAATAPGVAHAPASLRMHRSYSAVYVRRRGFAATCTSSAPIVARPPSGSFRLALISSVGIEDCLTHLVTEGFSLLRQSGHYLVGAR
jgi:hypothetical protein